MRKSNWPKVISLFILFAFYPAEAPAQGPYDYVVSVGKEQLYFVRRPELGYVVVSQKEVTSIESLDSTLRQFGARDIRAVRGLSRRGVSVVFKQRPASENENTIRMLRVQPQIKYATPLFSSNGQTVAIIPEIVVRLTSNSVDEQLHTLCHTMSLTIKNKLEFTTNEYLIEVSATDANGVFDAVEQLDQAEFIEWAVPNVAFRPQLFGQVIPNDTYFSDQWHLNNTGQSGGTANADVNAPEAWEISTGDPNIVVAVLDEGVDTNHTDLINNIVSGYDFYDDDDMPDPCGDDAHGTACAGLIAARGNNVIGVTGVAWNCKIMPIRIAGASGYITEADIATAIRWAANDGADVLSNSWGGNFEMPTIRSAIIDVTVSGGIGREGKGCVVLFSSGNWASGGQVVWPAKYSQVIAVGATNHNDVVWYYSGSGSELDIVAPSGECDLLGNIWTTDISDSAGYNNRDPSILDYTDKMGGTSGSCPIAAGAAALVLSVDPNLTNVEVQDILQTTSKDLGVDGFDNYYGHGRIDVNSAVVLVPVWFGTLPRSQLCWAVYYDWPEGEPPTGDEVRDLAVDNSGNVYVTGFTGDDNAAFDYTTIKYDADGNQLWVARYNGEGNECDRAYAIALDSLGNVYVTGSSTGSGTDGDYATIKYDADGNQLWVARYNGVGNGYDAAYAIALDGSGNVYVTGFSLGSGSNFDHDYATIKYDPNGNQLWVARYTVPENLLEDHAYAIALDSSSNVYVTGYSTGSGTDRDYATIKYDPNGNELWVARYNGEGNGHDAACAIALDSSANVYVTGYSTGSGTKRDYSTIKYDPNGNQLWVAGYNGVGNGYDAASTIALDSSGNVYVTGYSTGSGTKRDYSTIKYDPNGNQLWVARYNGRGDDAASAIALDSSSNVYVTGSSHYSSTNCDYLTIKYDRNGNCRWTARWNSSVYARGEDLAKRLSVDKVGNVYITGDTWGSYGCDYATIKYSQRNYCTAEIDGDLNSDCKVDFPDFAIIADGWLQDFDFNDLAILVEDWLKCNFALEEDCW